MTGDRLRSNFWVAALRRRAEGAGAYVAIARRGAEEAGAIFVLVDRRDGTLDLYGPAPQSVFGAEGPMDRLFLRLAEGATEGDTRAQMEREIKFDPDLWLIEIEDRAGRSFVEVVTAPEKARFTSR
jgi:hypothetical protein